MKKLLALTLAALLLAGCTAEPPAPSEPSAAATTPATEEIVITHEALEVLEFDRENVFSAAPMGDDLLLFSNMDSTTLIKVSGRNQKELAFADTGVPLSPDFRAVQVSESGVCYAAGEEHVFLNGNLEEVERVTLPGAWGTGAVAADQNTIYYSTGSQLRIYNRETGLDRLLRETMHTELVLESLELNDSVLVCLLLDEHAVPATLFYSAVTGELLATFEDSIALDSAGEMWLAKTSDGHRNQIVFGSGDESGMLTGWESFSDVTPVDGGVLIRTQTEDTAAIRFVDPAAGTEAAVALAGHALITNAWNTENVLWIALDDGRLLRWELENAETQAVSCITPHYSRENPDTEGLAALEGVIGDLENTYGVAIHIYEDAIAAQPGGMTLVSEYQVDALAAALEALKPALSPFTPEFLESTGRASDDGTIHICLVRAAEGDGCIQFWDEDGVARIVLEVDGQLQRDFFHGLAHLIDTRVMSECTAFDDWKYLNPDGFSYSQDYTAGGDPGAFPGAFTDALGMVSPVEDRACVFAAAMTADMDDVFEGEIIREKLSVLCAGIRRAYGLRDSEETFPWEQYPAE